MSKNYEGLYSQREPIIAPRLYIRYDEYNEYNKVYYCNCKINCIIGVIYLCVALKDI